MTINELTTEVLDDQEDWVHAGCGGEISYQEYDDGWFATCSNCDECWDEPDMFDQVRRKDFFVPLLYT
jgi:hypothetical protein